MRSYPISSQVKKRFQDKRLPKLVDLFEWTYENTQQWKTRIVQHTWTLRKRKVESWKANRGDRAGKSEKQPRRNASFSDSVNCKCPETRLDHRRALIQKFLYAIYPACTGSVISAGEAFSNIISRIIDQSHSRHAGVAAVSVCSFRSRERCSPLLALSAPVELNLPENMQSR